MEHLMLLIPKTIKPYFQGNLNTDNDMEKGLNLINREHCEENGPMERRMDLLNNIFLIMGNQSLKVSYLTWIKRFKRQNDLIEETSFDILKDNSNDKNCRRNINLYLGLI